MEQGQAAESYTAGLRKKYITVLVLAGAYVLLLTGCNPTAGATEYEVIYPSGYSRDCYTYDEISPIEGSSCCLQWKEADDYKETYDYDMQILDENGSVLYIYPDVRSKAMRGSVQEDEKTWVCAEHWTAPHHNGYVEGWLKESEKLLGLIKIPAEYAVIYYRDTSDWTQKHIFYTFDYVEEPDIDTSNGVLTRIKFYISENRLKAAWTRYESVGNGHWEYLEKKAYEIPLTENTSEQAAQAGADSYGKDKLLTIGEPAGPHRMMRGENLL